MVIPDLQGKSFIRLGMMNPKTLLPIASDVARAMNQESFFSFLHLPVQSGSDKVLESMGRGYTASDVMHILEIFRSYLPDIIIATDFITGFPGEVKEDHCATLDLMRKNETRNGSCNKVLLSSGNRNGQEE